MGRAGRRGDYPAKQRAEQKNDAAIALMMAIGQAMTEVDAARLDGFLAGPLFAKWCPRRGGEGSMGSYLPGDAAASGSRQRAAFDRSSLASQYLPPHQGTTLMTSHPSSAYGVPCT